MLILKKEVIKELWSKKHQNNQQQQTSIYWWERRRDHKDLFLSSKSWPFGQCVIYSLPRGLLVNVDRYLLQSAESGRWLLSFLQAKLTKKTASLGFPPTHFFGEGGNFQAHFIVFSMWRNNSYNVCKDVVKGNLMIVLWAVHWMHFLNFCLWRGFVIASANLLNSWTIFHLFKWYSTLIILINDALNDIVPLGLDEILYIWEPIISTNDLTFSRTLM